MAILDIRIFGDPVLRQQAREVTDFDARLQQLADDMFETMRAAPGVGLAAPQVGILKQLFTWEVDEDHGAIVNPRLDDASVDLEEDDEGCLSFPGLFYPVKRPLRVRITHRDLHGDEFEVDLEGFNARVWLHEMDHLNGILFVDHLVQHDKREAMKRMRQYRMETGLDEPSAPRPGGLLMGRITDRG